ncbi:MAG: hypothetical protein ACI4JF_08705 [Oscillospiraceae bacterium]
MAEKCPLCGSRLQNNVCISCGYELPDEKDISAPYDYDPDNDYFGEREQVRYYEAPPQATQHADMESISPIQTGYASAPKPAPNIKVNQAAPPSPAPKNLQNPQNVKPNPPPPQPSNPQLTFETIVKDVSTYIQKHWWLFLLLFLAPVSGFIIGIIYCAKSKIDGKGIQSVLTGIMYIVAAYFLYQGGVGIDALNELIFALFRE